MTDIAKDRLGVSKLDYFFSSHQWLFREQLLHDHGIDAQVEIVLGGRPTGDLVAIQIKSGTSYFSETTEDAIVFRTDNKHSKYWAKHCLPVIVVLYHPDEDLLYWESISEDTLTNTGKGWKIHIPKNKILTDESLDEITNLVQNPVYIQKLNKLLLDKPWMELVENDESVYIEFEDYINKTLSRFTLRIGCDSRMDIDEMVWPTLLSPMLSAEKFLSIAIPWADFEVDEDLYRENMEPQWYAECLMFHDKETGRDYFSENFDEWYSPPKGIVPCGDISGEVACYRLYLSLNDIGKAFLTLDKILSKDDVVFV